MAKWTLITLSIFFIICILGLEVIYRRLGKKIPHFMRFGLWFSAIFWVYQILRAGIDNFDGP